MLRTRFISVDVVLSIKAVSSGEHEKKDQNNEKEYCRYGMVYGN